MVALIHRTAVVRWLLRHGALFFSIAFSVLSCGEECTEQAEYGLSIQVVDSSNQEPICDALVVAKDGSYSETLVRPGGSPCLYAGAIERPGTYRIEASRDGYLPNTLDGVAVTKGECHVEPEVRTISLEPGQPECTPGDLFGCTCPGGGQGTQKCGSNGKLEPCEGC